MGLYINPKDMSKEDWLYDNNVNVSHEPFPVENIGDKNLAVCLVDNGGFTAAAVAFDNREYEVFKHNDGRPKIWFVVRKVDLKEVCPDYDSYVETVH